MVERLEVMLKYYHNEKKLETNPTVSAPIKEQELEL